MSEVHLRQCISNFNVLRNHMEILLKAQILIHSVWGLT